MYEARVFYQKKCKTLVNEYTLSQKNNDKGAGEIYWTMILLHNLFNLISFSNYFIICNIIPL